MREVFGGSAIIKGAFLLALVCALFLIAYLEYQPEPRWLQLIAAFGIWAIWMAWPRAVVLDEAGLSQRTRFGKLRRIDYNDVIAISHDIGETRTTVIGVNCNITLHLLHARRGEFYDLLTKRTGKKVAFGSG